MPFSRREVNINLQWLLDEYRASLSIGCGEIDVLMDYYRPHPSNNVIRIIDETYVYLFVLVID
jgi:hypothetical protein